MKIKSTKLIAMLLAVCMMFSFSSVVFAKDPDGRIDIDWSTVLEDLISKSNEGYSHEVMDGYLTVAVDGIGTAINAVGIAMDFVGAYSLEDAALEPIRERMVEELANTAATLKNVEKILSRKIDRDSDRTDIEADVLAALLELKDDLYTHLGTLKELAFAIGLALDPHIIAVEEAVNGYAQQIDQMMNDAYQNAVNTVADFEATYAAFVDEMVAYADMVDPALGAAVRKFLEETPEEALALIAAYGEDAVDMLENRAIAASGEIYLAVEKLAQVLYNHGTDIYGALAANGKVQELIAQIEEQFAVVMENEEAIEEWMKAPASNVVEFYQNNIYGNEYAAALYACAQLSALYNELSDFVVAVVEETGVDANVANAIGDILDTLNEVLSISADSAEGYLAWLCEHSKALGAALLAMLLENLEELLNTACPIIDAKIWEFLACLCREIIEFLPEADQWMYDWLYNNPDKVDAFFREYGDEIACLMEEYGDEALGILGYIAYTYGPEFVDYIIENPEESLELFLKWYDKYGYRIWPMVHVYADYYGICKCGEVDEIYATLIELGQEYLDCFIEMLEDLLDQLDAALRAEVEELLADLKNYAEEQYKLIEAKIIEIIGLLEEGYADLEAWYAEALYHATHAEYCVCGGEHTYVALGGMQNADDNAEKTYVDLFEEALEAGDAEVTVVNPAADEGFLTAKNAVEYVKANAAAIADADIITYNMDAAGTVLDVLQEVLANYMPGMFESGYVDWTEYADAETVAIAEKVLAEVNALLAEKYDAETVNSVSQIVEILVYAAVTYGAESYEALETVAAINPEALIVVVGMVNPLVGTTVVNNGETVDLGEIFDYVIEAADIYNEFYAIFSEKVTFVSAAGAETYGAIAPTEIVLGNVDIMDLLVNVLEGNVLEGAYLTDAGHADVCEALLAAIALDTEHEFGEWVVVKAAEVGVPGTEARECSVCGHKEEREIPALEDTTDPIVPPVITPTTPEYHYFYCDGGENCHCKDYVDLDNTMWYHQGVCYMIEHALMIGVGDNKWAPDQMITRAEIATILWREAGSKTVEYELTFSDVEADMWYTEAIEWAVSEEIFLGYDDGTFGPNDRITREQLVTVMYRFETENGKTVTADFDMTTVSDADEISEWAVEAMTWAFDCGLIIGTDVDVLTASPLKNATRAEAAMIFYRKLDNLLK